VSTPLRVEKRDGAIAVVTLSRPDRLNAIGTDTLVALDAALIALASDDRVRAFVVTGEGRAFCAGADIGELSGLDGAAGFARFVHTFTDVLDRLEAHPKPSVAAIDGAALGGGLELALACDVRVAADDARLGVPEIKLGLLPGAGGTQRLPRLLPRGVALQMLLTGAPLGAVDAHRLGLINELSGADPALGVAERLARELASGPPLAHRAAKHLVQRGALLPLTDAIDLERETVAELFATDDAAEGIAAFRAKRAPRFTGR
jgi:enoyl-CoA hydratase/carnithine racemase